MTAAAHPDKRDTPRGRIKEGILVQVPTLISSIPFGIVVGVIGAAGGLTFLQCLALALFPMSATVYLIGLQMTRDAAPDLIIIGTIMVMNLRMIMYSASIAPWLPPMSWPVRLLTAHCISDQTFAFAMVNFNRYPDRPNKHWHLIGGGLYSSTVWTFFAGVGYLAGAVVPASWSLEFGGTLTFLTLLVRSVNSVSTAVAAVFGASMVLVAWNLPMKLGVAVAIITGVIAGNVSRRMARA